MKRTIFFNGLLLIALTGIFLSDSSYAQGFGTAIYEGFGTDLHIQSKNNVTTLNADLGIVINPSFEIGLGALREEANSSDLAATGVGPYAVTYPLRQSSDIPVSLGISGSYLFYFFSGGIFDSFKDAGVDINAKSWTVSGLLFHRFEATPSFEIIPEIELGYNQLKVTASGLGEVASQSDSGTFGAVSARFVFDISNESRLAIIPKILFANDDSVFRFGIAWLRPR